MGNIIPWRKKLCTTELLDEIDREISSLQKTKEGNLNSQRKVVASLLIYSVFVYIFAAFLFYIYYVPGHWTHLLLYSVPLLLFPFLVLLVKRVLHWYFVKRISRNEEQLKTLNHKKDVILEDVMEKETFKKAKEILERYDPKKLQTIPSSETIGVQSQGDKIECNLQSKNNDVIEETSVVPQPNTTPPHLQQNIAGHIIQTQGHALNRAPDELPLPRPILPRERSFMDKMMEYLVGDGPQNRFALICSHCLSHNGMALKEEFEYVAFRCCYCYCVNPAKRQRTSAPDINKTEQTDKIRNSPKLRHRFSIEKANIKEPFLKDEIDKDL